MKIHAITYKSKCPCGKGNAYNYDKLINFQNVVSFMITCPDCKDKYIVRFDPTTKKMHFINKENKATYRFASKCMLSSVEKATYDTDYAYSLAELDELDSKSVYIKGE